jgi:hypothetical protein
LIVLTIIDCFSKDTHFIALGCPYAAVSVAHAFFDNIVRLHGVTCSIISERPGLY